MLPHKQNQLKQKEMKKKLNPQNQRKLNLPSLLRLLLQLDQLKKLNQHNQQNHSQLALLHLRQLRLNKVASQGLLKQNLQFSTVKCLSLHKNHLL